MKCPEEVSTSFVTRIKLCLQSQCYSSGGLFYVIVFFQRITTSFLKYLLSCLVTPLIAEGSRQDTVGYSDHSATISVRQCQHRPPAINVPFLGLR